MKQDQDDNRSQWLFVLIFRCSFKNGSDKIYFTTGKTKKGSFDWEPFSLFKKF